MSGPRPVVLLASVLGVLAVATAAAALAGPGGGGTATTGLGAGDGDGIGSGNSTGLGVDVSDGPDASSGGFPPLLQRLFTILLFASLVVPVVFGVVLVWQEGLAALWKLIASALRDLAVVIVVLAVLGLVLWLLLANLGDGGGGAMGESAAFDGLDFGDAAGSAVDSVPVPLPLVAVGSVVLLAGLVSVLTTAVESADTGSVSRVVASGDSDHDRVEPSLAVGFRDVDASNEVYSAWLALARSVTDSPDETVTPREVASMAVDSGLDEGAVEELTTLFQSVRYDGAAPTAERERRARAALERVRDPDGRRDA